MSQSAAGDETRTSNRDRDALVALENDWLKKEHNAAELEHILAADFLHPVVTGHVLTKAQHIKFSSTHLPPADLTKHFEGLQVRVYGDVGIVNGRTLIRSERGIVGPHGLHIPTKLFGRPFTAIGRLRDRLNRFSCVVSCASVPPR